jgi:hypothetical protein
LRSGYIKPIIYGLTGYKPFYSLSYQVLDLINSDHYSSWKFNPYNYYEFGTGEGNSLKYYLLALKKILKQKKSKQNYKIFLFDSFEGLPERKDEMDTNPAWKKGQFRGTEEQIKSVIRTTFPDMLSNTRIIKGYYDVSLTDKLRNELKEYPPSFVNVDVDLYSSTKKVLEFIHPICQDGTIFYFDDIWEYLGNLAKGEFKAIEEFNNQNKYQRFFPFQKFGIPRYTGKIFSLNSLKDD